jgi:hypothetical protein
MRRFALQFGILLVPVAWCQALPENAPKFYSDDPIRTEPETQDASGVARWKIDLFYDLMLNQFATPGLPAGAPAGNINTIDEVPDSSWFTNRILARPVSPAEALCGPCSGSGPVPGKWTVIAAKAEGAAPGFTIVDSAGTTWFIAFDPKSNPEGATGAGVVANRIFWILGYHQAEIHIAALRRDLLDVSPNATFTPPSGMERPLRLDDLNPIWPRVARNADGSYRVMASKLLPGKILGGFRYYGTRPDDPNDVVPHENRRELRALQVFGAWTNLVDMKALNTMDTLVTENGRARVRHYLLDVGSTFGMGANGPREWTEGYEYLFEQDKMLRRMYTFGLYPEPYKKAKYKQYPSIGRFEGDVFDPRLWKTRVPVSALLRAREDDLFWAARRVMAFSDELIREIVKAGRYTDPAAEKYLADVLIKRRDKIGEAYLTQINPLVDFQLSKGGTLSFNNAAERFSASAGDLKLKVAWFEFDNRSGAAKPIGESAGAGRKLSAPRALPSEPGAFVLAEVAVVDSRQPSWSTPVKAYFRRDGSAWQLVGVDRQPGAPQAAIKPAR